MHPGSVAPAASTTAVGLSTAAPGAAFKTAELGTTPTTRSATVTEIEVAPHGHAGLSTAGPTQKAGMGKWMDAWMQSIAANACHGNKAVRCGSLGRHAHRLYLNGLVAMPILMLRLMLLLMARCARTLLKAHFAVSPVCMPMLIHDDDHEHELKFC